MKILVKIAFAIMIIVLHAIWAHALTTEEVIKLKKAGVSDETIRLMIQQGSNPADQMGTREVKDADGNTSINYSTGAPPRQNSQQQQVDEAWKMLQNQNVIIDKRR